MKKILIVLFLLLLSGPSLYSQTFAYSNDLLSTNQVAPGGTLTLGLPKEVTGWNVELYTLQMRKVWKVPQTPLVNAGTKWTLPITLPTTLTHGIYLLLIQTDVFEKAVKLNVAP